MNKIRALAGLVALGAVGFAHDTAHAAWYTWYDNSGNNVYDSLSYDRWEDGSYDIILLDADENGYAESIAIDGNNDGWLEVFVHDYNQNGIMDVYQWDTDFEEGFENLAFDLNENGINDGLEQQFLPTIWASHPAAAISMGNPTGVIAVMGTTTNLLGGWLDSGDWDHDLVIDVSDKDPFNSSCAHAGDVCS